MRVLQILAIVSVLIVFISIKKIDCNELIGFNSLSIIDSLFLGAIFIFTYILTLQNMTDFYPRWDMFTYWALDSKYIFNFNKLHQGELDVLWRFRFESSFITIIYSLIYDLYGKIVEQYASWINVFINLNAMLIIYNLLNKKSVFQKLLVVCALVVIGFTADDIAFMYSLYGDIISAFLLLLFVLILTSDQKPDSKYYAIRLFVLLLISFSFYLVKSKFLFLTVGLPFVVLIYDFGYIKKAWKTFINKPLFLISLLFFLLFCGLYVNFRLTKVGNFSLASGVESFVQPSEYSLSSYFYYTSELIGKLMNYSRYLTIMWVIGVLSIIFVKEPLKNKKFMYTYIIAIVGFLVFIVAYINKQYPLLSGSLIRYTSLIMYLAPSIFAYPNYRIPPVLLKNSQPQDIKILRTISICLLMFIIIYLFNYKIYRTAPVNNDVGFVGGSLTKALPYPASLADKVLSIVEENSRILIADDKQKANLVDNLNQTSIWTRYYLMNNSVGGQYRTTIDNLIPFAEKYEADYILLISYENIFPNCENILEGGQDYLIALDDELTIGENKCPFSRNTIYDLKDD